MQITKKPTPVKKICALMSQGDDLIIKAETALINRFGNIDRRSPDFRFDYTDYYEEEMGKNLIKRFISFDITDTPELVWIDKLFTNYLEMELAVDGKRRINIDPGYLDKGKIVLLSTKSAPHRIYLAEGIYAEVTLIYKDGKFMPFPWSYIDFQSELASGFFSEVRGRYFEQVKPESEELPADAT